MAAELRLSDRRNLAYREAVLAAGPSLFVPLDSADGLTDLTGNYTATAAGGLTAGGYSSGPLSDPNNNGATDFDGTDDRITTDYATRRNLFENPSCVDGGTLNVGLYGSAGDYASYGFVAGVPNPINAPRVYRAVTSVNDRGPLWFSTYGSSVLAISTNYRAGAYVRGPAGASGQVTIQEYTSAGAWQQTGTAASFTFTGDWQWVESAALLTQTAACRFYMSLRILGATGTVETVGGILRVGTDDPGPAFSGDGYIDESGDWISDPGGHVGWTGTAHASASDKGVFAAGTDRTLSLWVNRDDEAASGYLLAVDAAGDNPCLYIDTTANRLTFRRNMAEGTSGETATGTPITIGEWAHIVCVIEGTGAITLYVNGATDPTWTSTPAITDYDPAGSISNLRISGRGTGTSGVVNGKMQGVAVFERGLSAYEVAALYAAASETTRTYDFLDTANPIEVRAEGLDLPVSVRDDSYVETPDADGRRRIRSRTASAEGSFTVSVRGSTAAEFWERVDDLQELVEATNRNKGVLTYTPPGGSPVSFDVETISISELPQRGVLLRKFYAEATVSFEALPYGKLPAELVTSGTLSGPIDSLDLSSVSGQAPALGSLRLADPESEDRNHVEVGVQHDYDPANPEALSLEAVADITAEAGSSNTRTGSVSTNIIRAALTTSAVTVAVAEDQPHSGKWKVRTRVWPSTTDVRVRLAWRAGNASFAREKWVTVPGEDEWYDLDLGTVDVPKLPTGHTADFRLEAVALSGVPTVDLDTFSMIPADNYTRLRGSTTEDTPTSAAVAAEDFSTHSAAALSGTTPLFAPSGNWSVSGFGGTWTTTAGGYAYCSSSFDTLGGLAGAHARLGTGTLTNSSITGKVTQTKNTYAYSGLVLRYVDQSNFLIAYFYNGSIYLKKVVAGTGTTLGSASAGGDSYIYLSAGSSGSVSVLTSADGSAWTWRVLVLGDSHIATAGALASGGYGMYHSVDFDTSVASVDDLVVYGAATAQSITNSAINADYGLELRDSIAYSDNATGTGRGVTPVREGQYLTVPPATRAGRTSRLVVRARRNDVDGGFTDDGEADTIDAELVVTPRVVLTRE